MFPCRASAPTPVMGGKRAWGMTEYSRCQGLGLWERLEPQQYSCNIIGITYTGPDTPTIFLLHSWGSLWGFPPSPVKAFFWGMGVRGWEGLGVYSFSEGQGNYNPSTTGTAKSSIAILGDLGGLESGHDLP